MPGLQKKAHRRPGFAACRLPGGMAPPYRKAVCSSGGYASSRLGGIASKVRSVRRQGKAPRTEGGKAAWTGLRLFERSSHAAVHYLPIMSHTRWSNNIILQVDA